MNEFRLRGGFRRGEMLGKQRILKTGHRFGERNQSDANASRRTLVVSHASESGHSSCMRGGFRRGEMLGIQPVGRTLRRYYDKRVFARNRIVTDVGRNANLRMTVLELRHRLLMSGEMLGIQRLRLIGRLKHDRALVPYASFVTRFGRNKHFRWGLPRLRGGIRRGEMLGMERVLTARKRHADEQYGTRSSNRP